MNTNLCNLLIIVACCITLAACSTATKIKSTSQKVDDLNKRFNSSSSGVMVVAHRACWRLAPENSIKSIKECINIGIDMVEVDVRRTKDGHLILMHDDSVDRTTNGIGLVSNLTLKEIKNLKLKVFDGGNNANLTNNKVPTLAEALLVAKNNILINLDAKDDVLEQAYQEAKSLNLLDHILIKMNLSAPTKVLQQSIFYKKTHFMPIINENKGSLLQMINNFNHEPQQAYEIIFKTELGLEQACLAAKKQGARCWVNTLSEYLSPGFSDERNITEPDKYWGELIKKFGVDIIQTDRPQHLINYLKNNNLY